VALATTHPPLKKRRGTLVFPNYQLLATTH